MASPQQILRVIKGWSSFYVSIHFIPTPFPNSIISEFYSPQLFMSCPSLHPNPLNCPSLLIDQIHQGLKHRNDREPDIAILLSSESTDANFSDPLCFVRP
jgi:hypothetical protein